VGEQKYRGKLLRIRRKQKTENGKFDAWRKYDFMHIVKLCGSKLYKVDEQEKDKREEDGKK
jgi:hypothetical protein